MRLGLAGTSLLFLLAACNQSAVLPDGNNMRPVEEKGAGVPQAAPASQLSGTPMAERVAVIGLLNKRNGLTRDLTMKPGQALRVGDAIVRLRACEVTAPWENIPETGAFVQLDVRSPKDNKWRRAFSGWLFRERPDRNVVQHPIYDVWVKNCAMSWPETGPETVKAGGNGASGAKASTASGSGEEPSNAASSNSGTSATASASSD